MNLTIKKIVELCNAKLYCGNDNVICKTFTKDTRILKKGDTYIGIKGENFDGNSLYKEAFIKGANCCILEEKSFVVDENYKFEFPIILVEDSITAIKKIAMYIRDNSKAIFIGITGSVGKTSTRDMIYSVVSKKYKSLKTEGNYNNNIGLPLTIMRLTDEECAVIEMGMNNLLEIDYLSKITKPHIAVITNVGTAHIGNLGSRKNILKAKLEITSGLDENGTLIINNDNDLLHEYYLNNKEHILTVGIDNESDIMAKDIIITDSYSKFKIVYKNNEYQAKCPVASKEYIYNSLIAFAVGVLTKIPIEQIICGINDFELTKNRLEFIKSKSGISIINDCYNASVDSMKSSLQILKNSNSKRKIAVLGSMLELGNFSKELHEEVGNSVVNNNIDILITVKDDAKYIASKAIKEGMNPKNIYSFENNIEAIEKLKEILNNEDCVLVKASNGLKFNQIVEVLKEL